MSEKASQPEHSRSAAGKSALSREASFPGGLQSPKNPERRLRGHRSGSGFSAPPAKGISGRASSGSVVTLVAFGCADLPVGVAGWKAGAT